jgi:hypothetical protein
VVFFICIQTHNELLEFARCSSENIIHTLTSFHKEGIIQSDGNKIQITNMAKLTEISRLG